MYPFRFHNQFKNRFPKIHFWHLTSQKYFKFDNIILVCWSPPSTTTTMYQNQIYNAQNTKYPTHQFTHIKNINTLITPNVTTITILQTMKHLLAINIWLMNYFINHIIAKIFITATPQYNCTRNSTPQQCFAKHGTSTLFQKTFHNYQVHRHFSTQQHSILQ